MPVYSKNNYLQEFHLPGPFLLNAFSLDTNSICHRLSFLISKVYFLDAGAEINIIIPVNCVTNIKNCVTFHSVC